MTQKIDPQYVFEVAKKLEKYIQDSEESKVPVVQPYPIPKVFERLGISDLDIQSGLSQSERLDWISKYLELTTHLHHPGYIAHQIAVPNQGSAIADLINGMTNNGMGVYEMGPAGVTIERFVKDLLLDRLHWKGLGDASLVHGGSIANLTALLSARAHCEPSAWTEGVDAEAHVFLVPNNSHYSVHRAIAIMGYGQKAIWPIQTNESGKILIEPLRDLIKKAQVDSKKIVAVVANGCATATGLYDPIDLIADLCEDYGLWFHVDGAHGASALFSDQYRGLLNGAERAHSIIWDLHKMAGISTLCAAVLFRDQSWCRSTFSQNASYLEHEHNPDREDLFENTIECTRAPIGLKFFMHLLTHGSNSLGKFIDHSYSITKKFYQIINQTPGFYSPFEPESNILLFEAEGKNSDMIYQKLIENGKFYITKTKHKDKTYLRLTVMNPLTTVQTIQSLLQTIDHI